jgi:hypothetical protein
MSCVRRLCPYRFSVLWVSLVSPQKWAVVGRRQSRLGGRLRSIHGWPNGNRVLLRFYCRSRCRYFTFCDVGRLWSNRRSYRWTSWRSHGWSYRRSSRGTYYGPLGGSFRRSESSFDSSTFVLGLDILETLSVGCSTGLSFLGQGLLLSL